MQIETAVTHEHSSRGASSMDRWSACPGSVALSKGLVGKASKYAEEGTKAHLYATMWLTLDMEPKFPDTESGREMREAVKEYVDRCKSYITFAALNMGAIYGVEHKFDLSKIHPGCFGTADFWVYWPWLKKLIVIDFKYGAGVFVSAVGNLQMQYYALGCVSTLGLDVGTIELGISQPRCRTDDGEVFRTWTINKIDLLFDFKPFLIASAKATEAPNAPLVPGEHCRWCLANEHRVCPEIEKQKDEHVQLVFQIQKTYDPFKLKKALDGRDLVKAWLKSLDEFAYAELEQGKEIPGYKLVQKRPRRAWIDESTTVKMLTLTGYGEEIYEDRVLKSPTEIEKILGAHKKLIDPQVRKESSGHTLVTMDDDRPAIAKGPESVFKPIKIINPLE